MALSRTEIQFHVDEILDEARRYFVISDEVAPVLARDRVKKAIDALLGCGTTPAASSIGGYAFLHLMEALGIKTWSTDEAEAEVIGNLRARRELTPETPPNEDLVVALRTAELMAKAAADVAALHSDRGTEADLLDKHAVPAEVLVALRALRAAIYEFRRNAYFVPGNPAELGNVLSEVEIQAVREQKVRMVEDIRALREAKGVTQGIHSKRKALLEQRERDEAVNEALEALAVEIEAEITGTEDGPVALLRRQAANIVVLVRNRKRQIG